MKNPNIHIEISGHTDNVGTREYNENLSLKRAGAVREYLIQRGIAMDRMLFSGYGFSRPVDTNDTETGRANNRRTEFKIIRN
jgi:outer membrane protein OmpA-like peptidoglycan-associated protein